MADPVAERRRLVLSHETSLAFRVSHEVVPSPPVTPWEVLIPIFLIFNYVRRKQGREWFVANHLFTKKLALEGAFDLVRGLRNREEIRACIEADTAKTLEQIEGGVYTEAIRSKQLSEMEVLTDHYVALLSAEGRTYEELARSAYRERVEFERAMESLLDAERAVTAAAQEVLGERADPAFAARLTAASERVRMEDVEQVFAP